MSTIKLTANLETANAKTSAPKPVKRVIVKEEIPATLYAAARDILTLEVQPDVPGYKYAQPKKNSHNGVTLDISNYYNAELSSIHCLNARTMLDEMTNTEISKEESKEYADFYNKQNPPSESSKIELVEEKPLIHLAHFVGLSLKETLRPYALSDEESAQRMNDAIDCLYEDYDSFDTKTETNMTPSEVFQEIYKEKLRRGPKGNAAQAEAKAAQALPDTNGLPPPPHIEPFSPGGEEVSDKELYYPDRLLYTFTPLFICKLMDKIIQGTGIILDLPHNPEGLRKRCAIFLSFRNVTNSSHSIPVEIFTNEYKARCCLVCSNISNETYRDIQLIISKLPNRTSDIRGVHNNLQKALKNLDGTNIKSHYHKFVASIIYTICLVNIKLSVNAGKNFKVPNPWLGDNAQQTTDLNVTLYNSSKLAFTETPVNNEIEL